MNNGFDYMGKRYLWKNKELYRLPFQSDLNFYGVKKCTKWKDGYILGSQRKSLAQLKGMNNKRIYYEIVESEYMPF